MFDKIRLRDVKLSYYGSIKSDIERKSCWLSYYFYRPLSFLVTPFFINFGIRPNTVTWLGFLFGLISLILYFLGDYIQTILACLFYFIFNLFDHIDGNIARIQNKTNYYGKYLDSITGVIIAATLDFAIATGIPDKTLFNEFPIILIGGLSSILFYITFVINIRFDSLLDEIKSTNKNNFDKDIKLFSGDNYISNARHKFKSLMKYFKIVKFIDTNFLFFLLLVATIFKYLIVYLLISFSVKIIIFIASFLDKTLVRRFELKVKRTI